MKLCYLCGDSIYKDGERYILFDRAYRWVDVGCKELIRYFEEASRSVFLTSEQKAIMIKAFFEDEGADTATEEAPAEE